MLLIFPHPGTLQLQIESLALRFGNPFVFPFKRGNLRCLSIPHPRMDAFSFPDTFILAFTFVVFLKYVKMIITYRPVNHMFMSDVYFPHPTLSNCNRRGSHITCSCHLNIIKLDREWPSSL